MKVSIHFCYILVIFTISTTLTSAYPKSSNDNRFSLSKDYEANSYPVKRKAPNLQPPTFVSAHDEQQQQQQQPDYDPNMNEQSARYRRIDNNYDRKSQSSLEKELDLKRTSLMNHMGKRADRLYKRDLRPSRREEAYGIVYGNGRPIGILEPFPQTYELSPMYNSREGIEEIEPVPQVNPRSAMDMFYTDRLASNSRNDWEDNPNNVQEPGKFTNEKYPAVLNEYKISTNRLNSNGLSYKHENNDKLANNQVPAASKRDAMLIDNNQKKSTSEFVQKDAELDNLDEPNKVVAEVKRSAVGITNEKIDKLKSALNRMQNPGPSDRVEEIEDNLRDILSDMGLIEGEYSGVETYKNKRDNEAKRDVDKEDENLEEGENKIDLVKATHEAPVAERTKREDKKETSNKDVDKAKSENVQETKSLNKDQELIKTEPSEIKISENSAKLKSDEDKQEVKRSDLKINVANYQAEGDAYIRSKRQENNDLMKGLEKSGDLTVSGNKSPLACSDNDAEMEKRRNKDQTTAGSISDKTKREQHDEYQYQKEIEQNIQAKIDAIKEQVKREIEALKTKSSQENLRQKRDVNTLLAEESSALDPQKHPDEKLIPHIRRRRNLEELQTLTREKRGLPDFSNLKDIDSGDYLDLAGEKLRNQRDTVQEYEVDPQENKFLPEVSSSSVDDTLEKKRSSGNQEGLPAAETAPLNVNNQDDTNLPNDNTKIRERSVDDLTSSSKQLKKESTSPEALTKEAQQQPNAIHQSDDKISEANKNEEQANVVAPEIAKSHDEPSMEKRSPDSQAIPENFVDQQELNSKNKPQVEVDKKRETSNVNNIKIEEDQKSKRDVTVSAKYDDASSSKGTEEPNVIQKKETKRSIEDSLLNLKSPLQPEEQDLQETVNSRRMRRQVEANPSVGYGRRKRANAVIPYAKSSFFPYRAEEEDGDDEGDEFDEDSFEDRSNLQKREAGYNFRQKNQFRRSVDYQPDYAASDDYPSSNYQQEQKRSLASRYVANENSDVYENPNNYLYHPVSYVRQKRQNFDQLASLHGGGPMLHHLAAIRDRSMQQFDEESNRNKRNFNKIGQNSENQIKEEPENSIADLSASDLFGALPQSYDGSNLQRFKRIKRDVLPNSSEKIQKTTTEISVKV